MSNQPDPIDVHVGQRMRALRRDQKKSQEAMALHLGVSFQQIQKQERAVNRLSASALYRAAQFLGVTPDYFFEGYSDAEAV